MSPNTPRPTRGQIILTILLGLSLLTVSMVSFRVIGIRNGSMAPALAIGDWVVANRWSYVVDEPQRGQIVVFRYPRDHRKQYSKRVVAVAGDRIELRGRGIVLNGAPLPRSPAGPFTLEYSSDGALFDADRVETMNLLKSREVLDEVEYEVLHDPGRPAASCSFGCKEAYTVPEGHVFLLGDNRDNSADSRVFGPVPVDDVVARVIATF